MPVAFVLKSRLTGAFYAKRETSCSRTVHLKILYVPAGEEAFDYRLELAVCNVFLDEQAPASRKGFDGSRAPAKFFGKSGVLGIARASIQVNIDWTGLRQGLNSREAIIDKEDAPVSSGLNRAKAVTAGSVVGTHFRVRGKSIDRSP
jgi:hypothetical protein